MFNWWALNRPSFAFWIPLLINFELYQFRLPLELSIVIIALHHFIQEICIFHHNSFFKSVTSFDIFSIRMLLSLFPSNLYAGHQ